MNGRGKPGITSIRKLASKFGPEIYDIFGLPQPPKAFRKLVYTYNKIPAEERQLFELEFDCWLGDWLISLGFIYVK